MSAKRFKEAQAYIHSKSNYKGDFKNGIALCQAAEKIDPKIWKQSKPKKLQYSSNTKTGVASNRERIESFIKFCANKGIAEHDRFVTLDLVESKDITKVCICIEALKRRVTKGKDVNEKPKKKIDKSNWINGSNIVPKSAQTINIESGEGVDGYGIVKHSNVSKTKTNEKKFKKVNTWGDTSNVMTKQSQGSNYHDNSSGYDQYGIVKHANVSKSNFNQKQYNKTNNYKSNPNAIPKHMQGSNEIDNSSGYDQYGIVKHANVSNSNWNKKQYEKTNNYSSNSKKKDQPKKKTSSKKKNDACVKPSSVKKQKSKGGFLSSVFAKKKNSKKKDAAWIKH